MAELVIRADYASKTRTFLIAALRVTFPLWGIVGPIAAAICIFLIIAAMHSTYNNAAVDESIAKLIAIALAGLAVPAAALMTTRSLSNDCLIADKTGLQLPLLLCTFGRHTKWSDIAKIAINPAVSDDINKQSLVFYTKSGGSFSLELRRIDRETVEQLLIAVDSWAPECEKDPSLATFQQSLKITDQSESVSYTDMWEDELRRRFCATAFIPLEPGTHLRNGSLKVIRHLALGGLSALYLCQLKDNELVVLKEAVVPEDAVESVKEKALEMFEREAALLMKLKHPNIVRVLDRFVSGGRHYMMMEYISGQDLRQYVKQNGPQGEAVVTEWAVQIAALLKHLHEQDPPIIHRDLTPDNLVLREDGTIVLIDFGAANEFIGNATGTFVGKQSFISPEQFRGKAVVQSDIYAFGCTLFYLLTGHEPEALETSRPQDFAENVSDDLNEIVVCCTQMEARDRYQSAAQLIPVLKRMAAV